MASIPSATLTCPTFRTGRIPYREREGERRLTQALGRDILNGATATLLVLVSRATKTWGWIHTEMRM